MVMVRENHIPKGIPVLYTKTDTSSAGQTEPHEITYVHWGVFHRLSKILVFWTGRDTKSAFKRARDFARQHSGHTKHYVRVGEPITVGRGQKRRHGVDDGKTHGPGEA